MSDSTAVPIAVAVYIRLKEIFVFVIVYPFYIIITFIIYQKFERLVNKTKD